MGIVYIGDTMAAPIPNKKIESKILEAIDSIDLGVSLADAAKFACVQRKTAEKHLTRLCNENTLVEHRKGIMRIFTRV